MERTTSIRADVDGLRHDVNLVEGLKRANCRDHDEKEDCRHQEWHDDQAKYLKLVGSVDSPRLEQVGRDIPETSQQHRDVKAKTVPDRYDHDRDEGQTRTSEAWRQGDAHA